MIDKLRTRLVISVQKMRGVTQDTTTSVMKAPKSAFNKTKSVVKTTVAKILAIPGAILRSPMGAFRKSMTARDWVFEKIEYLNSESEKWKRAFNIAKSPYSFLRMMGLSPQMAAGLLVAGSTVGGGVVVNETIIDRPP